jgi:hypothetical protein
MPRLLPNRTAQNVMEADFNFSFNDWAVDSVDGVRKTFGSTAALADPSSSVPGLTAGTGIVLDAIPMPIGSVIVGGEVIVETAYVGIGAGATMNIGIAGNTAALLSAFDLDAALAGSRTALLLTTPLLCNGGQNIRITNAGLTATATAGRVRVRVLYTIDGRANEVIPA